MQKLRDIIEVHHNINVYCRERGKLVPGTRREGHNVFTTTGRDWLAHLAAWQTIGAGGDIPFTNRRVRWMAVGTGTQAEVEGVTALNAHTPITAGIYLGDIETTDFPTSTSVRFTKEFNTSEISLPGEGLPVVAVTEAGLYVDVYPVSGYNGVDDSAVGGGDTTLNPASQVNPPVAYKTFEAINKTVDFSLVIEWTFVFG